MATLHYPQSVPSADDLRRYLHHRENVPAAVGFLDHLCHPVSLLLYLMGMPATLFYERTTNGAGIATFTFADGRLAALTFTHGAAANGGMERTMILSDRGGQILVENNLRVTHHRDAPGRGYGTSPTYYTGDESLTSTVWEPEFSLGQLYNKGLFLLGYFGEVNEFARSILEKRPPVKCHLRHARQVTEIFSAFAEGPSKVIEI